MPYANNKDTDQPVHPHSLVSACIISCLDRIRPIVALSEILIFLLASEANQAVFWTQTSDDRFSHDNDSFINTSMKNFEPEQSTTKPTKSV